MRDINAADFLWVALECFNNPSLNLLFLVIGFCSEARLGMSIFWRGVWHGLGYAQTNHGYRIGHVTRGVDE